MSVLTTKSAKKIQPNPYVLAEGTITLTVAEHNAIIKRTDKPEKPKKNSKFKVLVTREPQDFWHMYSNGPRSCMAYTSRTFGTQFQWMLPYKLHPNSSLVYDPYVRGIYIKDEQDRTIWRAIAQANKHINNDDMTKLNWRAPTPYYNTGFSVEALHDFLDEKLNISIENNFGTKYSYEFPPIHINLGGVEEKLMIVPYFDDKEYNGRLIYNGNNFKLSYGCHYTKQNFHALHGWAVEQEKLYLRPDGSLSNYINDRLESEKLKQFKFKTKYRRSIFARELVEMGQIK